MKSSSPETCLFVTHSPRQASLQSLPQCCLPSCAPSTSRSLKMRQSFIFQYQQYNVETNQSKVSLTRIGDIKISFKDSGHLLLVVNQRWVWFDPVSGWSLLCKKSRVYLPSRSVVLSALEKSITITITININITITIDINITITITWPKTWSTGTSRLTQSLWMSRTPLMPWSLM